MPRAGIANGKWPIRSSEPGEEIVLTIRRVDPAGDSHVALPSEHLRSGFLRNPEEPPVFGNLAAVRRPGRELAIDKVPYVYPGSDIFVRDPDRRSPVEFLLGDFTCLEESPTNRQGPRTGKGNPVQLAGGPQSLSVGGWETANVVRTKEGGRAYSVDLDVIGMAVSPERDRKR